MNQVVKKHFVCPGYRERMPLRLTVNDRTLSGHEYDDVLGERYEFPTRYQQLIQPGVRFVYYRGRRRADGRSGRQEYLGAGVVGTVERSRRDPSLLVCRIEDWCPFTEPLYFKDAEGMWYEPGGVHGGLYWRQGVREIPDDVFDHIVGDASHDA